MRSRRLVVSAAAIVAAAVGFLPGTAQAADPSAPVARHAAKTPDLKKAGAQNIKTFKSGPEKSHRGGAAAAAAADAAVAGNPDLKIALTATNTTARGIHLETAVTSVPSSLRVTISWGDGTLDTIDTAGAGTLQNEHVYAKAGTYKISVGVDDPANKIYIENEVTIVTAGSEFTPHAPTRLLDTRDGFRAPKAKVGPRSSVRVQVADYGLIPKKLTAVVLNVTVTNTIAGGHISAHPSGTPRPLASNVNYEAGRSVPNLVIVPVGEDGSVELFNGGWESVDLIADITGYFTQTAASGYTPMAPARFVDTREGLGTKKGQVPGQTSFGTQISGLRGVPQGVTAVALNVTVTNPKEAGHVVVYPSGGRIPLASNVNFTAGQTVANSVIVPVGPDGSIDVRNSAWAGADVIVDVVGYYSPGSKGALMSFSPVRWLDTRDPEGGAFGPVEGRGYIASQLSHWEPGDTGVSGVVLNTTVTNTAGAGFLSVAPDPNSSQQYDEGTAVTPERPTASTLNWTKGGTVANLVQADTGKHGVVDFWNQGWDNADLVVDLFGFYDTE
ncbi:hypothetical protein ACFYYM_09765 [Streptomyces erythrochromogenes]|uniref:hypothetical protein n=1 Tax=Streptomyces erythrochromogenes TaxID=285574 RepID=UPI0036B69499